MAKGGKNDGPEGERVNICRNRRATHDYEILDRIECGIVLVGTEVKTTCRARVALPVDESDNPWRRHGDQWKP